MKKLCPLLLALAIVICAIGCSPKLEVTTMSFSDYYQGVDDFDEIEPALNLYFSCIRSAYDNSNKTDLKSFELADEYAEARDALQAFSESGGELSDVLGNDGAAGKALAKLRLLEPYLRIENMLAERLLLLRADSDAKNAQWFDSLNSLVWDSIDEYRRGEE